MSSSRLCGRVWASALEEGNVEAGYDTPSPHLSVVVNHLEDNGTTYGGNKLVVIENYRMSEYVFSTACPHIGFQMTLAWLQEILKARQAST